MNPPIIECRGLHKWYSGVHALKGVNQQLLPQAYGAALQFWSYPILIILALGTFRYHRRLRRSTA